VRLLTISAVIGAVMVIPAVPVGAGTPPPCEALAANSNTIFPTLQGAVDAVRATFANPAVVRVRGTCRGTTLVKKDVTIVGVDTTRTGRATLVGPGTGRVVTIGKGFVVTMTDLIIRGGDVTGVTDYPGNAGGGIRNNGTLTLERVTLKRNRAAWGGGISSAGKLTILGSRITTNTATRNGGGVDVDGQERNSSSLIERTQIDHNVADVGGGGINNYAATLVVLDTELSDNRARLGGAISGVNITRDRTGLDVRSRIYLRGGTWLHHNVGTEYGAAINAEGLLSLEDDTFIDDHDIGGVQKGGVVEVFAYPFSLPTEFTMIETSYITDNVGGPDGGAVVVWRDCGGEPVVVTGVGARTKGNTPANVVTRTGTEGC
jgi:hypothetical protein